MIVFLSWAFLGALIGVHAAQKRNLSVVGAAIGGVLLGPLAFLMYFARDTSRRCPHCAERIQAAAAVCRHCGRELVRTL